MREKPKAQEESEYMYLAYYLRPKSTYTAICDWYHTPNVTWLYATYMCRALHAFLLCPTLMAFYNLLAVDEPTAAFVQINVPFTTTAVCTSTASLLHADIYGSMERFVAP